MATPPATPPTATTQDQKIDKLIQEYKEGKKTIEEFAKALETEVKIHKDVALSIAKAIEIRKKSVDQLREEIAIYKLLGEVEEASISTKKLQIQNIDELIKLKKMDIIEGEKRKKQLLEEIDAIRGVSRATEDFITTALGVDDRWKNTLVGSILSGDTKENLKTFADKAKKQLSFENIIGSTMLKVQEATVKAFIEMDSAFSSFAAVTGASREYNDVITATARGNTALGISFQQSGKAVTDLYTNLNTFSTLNKSAQEELTVTTAKLEKLGISGGETAKSIQTLSIMMGVTELQAADTVEQFAAMGQAIGVSSKQMISDFIAVKDQLAVFGSSMDETFLKLEAQAKATGVAVNDLLNITNKFDTFESAANQVAKLNAMLGGPYLSAMTMIEKTDPTERINMIRESVNNAGMSFQSMSYYQKKAIMEAGGFKSIEEAQRILSMSAGEAAEELQKQQASQEELNKAIERAQPIQEKMSMIMANFAVVMQGPVEMLSSFLTIVIKVMDELPFLSYLLGGIIVAFIALKIISTIAAMFSALAGAFSIFTPAAGAAGPAATGAAGGIEILSTALGAAAPVILVSSKALGILALVLLAVGASIVLIGFGFKLMLEGLASVIKEAVKAPEVFYGMAAGLLALAAAITIISLNPFATLGIAQLALSIYAISAAINAVDTEKVVSFKAIMEKSVEISEPSIIEGFEKFSEKFSAVAKATANINANNTKTFVSLLNATQNLSQALKLDQTVIVQVGDKKFEGYIKSVVNNMFPDSAISSKP